MTHGSLFSGIGGFDLAAEWMGWDNVFHCEWMPFPRKVLDYYWPNADSHIDICKTNFKKYEGTIDIISGGFPCQPFSLAGKRKGTDDERYLWGEMLRAIQEIKPQYVIAENVFGITNIDGGMVFEQVCLDLEIEGYEVQPFIIPAAAKNAPHRRDRCWFVATNTDNTRNTTSSSGVNSNREEEISEWKLSQFESNGLCDTRNATDTDCIRCGRRSEQSKSNQSKERKICENEQQHRDGVRCKIEGCSWNNTNTKGIRPIQRNTIAIGKISKRDGFEALCESTNWESFPTQSPICGGDDGIPTELDGITFSKWRAESIKGYGNAIVPQVAYEIFKSIIKTKQ